MKSLDRKQRIAVASLAFAASAFGVLLHVSSYWWSPSLRLLDVEVQTDQGLVVIHLPLTRLEPDASPESRFVLYRADATRKGWFAEGRGRSQIRGFLEYIRYENAFLFADFGYWLGAWQSEARPGRFLYVLAPCWFVALGVFLLSLAVYFRMARFSIRALLALTAMCGAAVWLLNLHKS